MLRLVKRVHNLDMGNHLQDKNIIPAQTNHSDLGQLEANNSVIADGLRVLEGIGQIDRHLTDLTKHVADATESVKLAGEGCRYEDRQRDRVRATVSLLEAQKSFRAILPLVGSAIEELPNAL